MKHFTLLLLFVLVLSGSASVQAQTGDCSAPINASPSGVSAKAIGRHSAIIRWQAVPGAKGYALDFGLAEQDPKRWPTFMICDAKEEYKLTGLKPGQTYRAHVRTLCAECSKIGSLSVSPWSLTVEFTMPSVPQVPFNPSNPVDPNAPVAGRYVLAGQVIDSWHRPVEGARVKRGSVESQTDAKGRFTLAVNEARPAETTPVLVVVEKDGYWSNASRQYLHAQDTTETMLMLREQRVTNRVDAKKGGEMLYKNYSLQLPPNGVQTEDGTPYTGTILLSVDGATPSERDFGLRMPGGDFSAIDENGNDVMLYSYGFLSAEMTTESGQKLEFRPGAEATLRFSLPWNEQHRPNRVPLWHFNETTAIWEQEGWSVKNGSVYEGKVSHFSSWNCDIPAERGVVRGRVIDCNGAPLKGGWVRVGQRFTVTDSAGRYWSFVPGGITFDVWTLADTLRDISVPVQQVRVLEDLTGADFNGLAVYDPLKLTLSVYLSGNVPENLRLSVDGGQSWTEQREFSNVSVAPNEIRLEGGCADRLQVITTKRQEDCLKLDSLGLLHSPKYSRWEDALSAEEPVYWLQLLDGRFRNEWDLLSYFSCLQRMELYDNQLTSLPESFGNLSSLQALGLSSNNLTSLPESFGNFSSLKALGLSFNRFSSLPESIFALSSLQRLYFSNNNLSSLPESFGNLSRLQVLDLSHNQLTSLPENIANLGSLQKLLLNNNNISSFPEVILNLNSLQTLDLSGGNLTSLPDNFDNLSNLEVLSLNFNRITSLPEVILNLSSLQTLDLAGNQLTSIPENIGDLINLRELGLYHNQLTDLPDSIANLADTLQRLILTDNPIPLQRLAAIQAMLPNTTIEW